MQPVSTGKMHVASVNCRARKRCSAGRRATGAESGKQINGESAGKRVTIVKQCNMQQVQSVKKTI